jgi:hypothetical protein
MCKPFIQSADETDSCIGAMRATGSGPRPRLGVFAREFTVFAVHRPTGDRSRRPSWRNACSMPPMERVRAGRFLAVVLVIVAACGAHAKVRPPKSGPPSAAKMAELWNDPVDVGERDLFGGPGGMHLAPDPTSAYAFKRRDTKGSSRGYHVHDPSGLEWAVKIGPEAQTEVVVSRLLWAAGYHQPPTYYVPQWQLEKDGTRTAQPPGRFRPQPPDLRKVGRWPWHANPFVGTRPYRGLLVLNMLVNNWDLKTSQNVLYALDREREGARHWYVIRDLGASLGRTPGRILDGTPNDLAGFEQQGFIAGVEGGHVRFDYRRPHTELLADITPADVRWACELLARLSPRQWNDAFRAGGYGPDESARYIRKMQAKIAEGRALAGTGS